MGGGAENVACFQENVGDFREYVARNLEQLGRKK